MCWLQEDQTPGTGLLDHFQIPESGATRFDVVVGLLSPPIHPPEEAFPKKNAIGMQMAQRTAT
jgi:hypothetical protein